MRNKHALGAFKLFLNFAGAVLSRRTIDQDAIPCPPF